MPDRPLILSPPWKKWPAAGCLAILVLYLLLRYTHFLNWVGLLMPPVVTGVVPGWPGPGMVLAFGLLGGYMLMGRSFQVVRWGWLGTGLGMLTLLLATIFYAPATDEVRDYEVTQSLATYGGSHFWQVPTGMPAAKAGQIQGLQRLHPPLNTVGGSWFLPGDVSLAGFRLFWLLIALLGGGLLVSLGRRNVAAGGLLAGGLLLMAYPHFRNYMLIRGGNDLLGFVGMGAWVLLHLPLLREGKPLSWARWLALVAVLGLAIWSKFSSLVAMGAWLGALGWMVIAGKKPWGRIWLAGLAAFLLVVLAYGLTWWGTPMLDKQIAHYGRYAERLGIELPFAGAPPPDERRWRGDQPPGEGALSQLNAYEHRPDTWYPAARLIGTAVRLPFWLGPWLGGLLLLAAYSRWRHPDRWPPWERLLGNWVVLGAIGVALVEPAIHYTAPLTLGMLWLGLHAWQAEGGTRAQDVRLLALMGLFAWVDTFFPLLAQGINQLLSTTHL